MKFPYNKAIQLAKVARPLLPRGRSLLYHGTRAPTQILRENVLLVPRVGIQAVSFSRQLHVAIYWATHKRENDKLGAVFVLDRDLLAHTYKLEPFRDPIWDDHPERSARKSSEAEEYVWLRDVVGLNHYLVDVIWFSPDGSLHSAAKRRSQRDYYRHHSISNLVIGSQARSSRRQTKQRLVVVKRAHSRAVRNYLKELDQRDLVEAQAARTQS